MYPVEMAYHQLQASTKFYNQYISDSEKSDQDFKAEFLSYWTRLAKEKRAPILSLLELNSEPRKVFFTVTPEDRCLVAEDVNQAKKWIGSLYPQFQEPKYFSEGYIFPLNEAPTPPFPSDLTELDTFLSQYSPASLSLYRESLRKNKQQLYIFTAQGRGVGERAGTGAMCITTRLNGRKVDLQKGSFTNINNVPLKLLQSRINQAVNFERRIVSRVDHIWIHNRGYENANNFAEKKVMLLGCGSLGSHVAVRLAQMGVGAIYLVDPQTLESANISRHALGAFALGKHKAKMLAGDLRVRFPHLTIGCENVHWQALSEEGVKFMNDSDLIVSTMAEWSGEGLLNEFGMTAETIPPILYGWIEARAVAAHAVLIQNQDSCLGCVRNTRGVMYEPESINWPDIDGIQSEPACGTLYQPYGAIDLSQGEMLVANTVSDFLSNKLKSNHHFVQTVSSERIAELGGEWSTFHKDHRPSGYSGILNYERNFIPNHGCLFHKT